MDAAVTHTPVLLREVVEGLKLSPAGFYVDCTFGAGGHTRAILCGLGADGRVLATDRDPQAILTGTAWADDHRLELVHERFSNLGDLLRARGVWRAVDGVLLDLGVSSPQLDDPRRGFSFGGDGPLDMRMDNSTGASAADWLNSAREEQIADCLWCYGEERHSRRIARHIIAARRVARIETTRQLAEIVARAVPGARGRRHPATRAFQAIRIRVNDELEELSAGLVQACGALACGGRVAVIAFHSLEDRVVKRFFRDLCQRRDEVAGAARFHAVTRKPIRPSAAEVASNPRARSGRLRIVERCA